MNRQAIKIVLVSILVLGLRVALAEKAPEQAQDRKILKTERNELSGVISGITKSSVSLVYGKDKKKDIEYEAVFPINEDIQLEHLKSLSDLRIGDEVKIRFEDTNFENSDKSQKVQRKAKVISLIKAAVPILDTDTLLTGTQ